MTFQEYLNLVNKIQKDISSIKELNNPTKKLLDELKKVNDISQQEIHQLLPDNEKQPREILIKFLQEIDPKELDKCEWITNIPDVVDNYLRN